MLKRDALKKPAPIEASSGKRSDELIEKRGSVLRNSVAWAHLAALEPKESPLLDRRDNYGWFVVVKPSPKRAAAYSGPPTRLQVDKPPWDLKAKSRSAAAAVAPSQEKRTLRLKRLTRVRKRSKVNCGHHRPTTSSDCDTRKHGWPPLTHGGRASTRRAATVRDETDQREFAQVYDRPHHGTAALVQNSQDDFLSRKS